MGRRSGPQKLSFRSSRGMLLEKTGLRDRHKKDTMTGIHGVSSSPFAPSYSRFSLLFLGSAVAQCWCRSAGRIEQLVAVVFSSLVDSLLLCHNFSCKYIV